MRTVKEVSKLTGVSVRTLHYYDAIGLLEPTKVTDAGYRMYDDTSLSRLQNILLFRELQFPLKEIKEILDSPNFNQEEAVAQQIKLLELQYKHIGELISFAREIQDLSHKTNVILKDGLETKGIDKEIYMAVISLALQEYLEDVHDVESGIITIKPKQTRWNAPKFNNNNNNVKI